MSKDFLIECGCEEIPARFMDSFIDQLKELFKKEFVQSHIKFKNIYVYGTYRRLVVYVPELAEFQTQVDELIKGPPKDIAYNKDLTHLTHAGKGFLNKFNINEKQLIFKTIENREYLAFLKKGEVQKTQSLLF